MIKKIRSKIWIVEYLIIFGGTILWYIFYRYSPDLYPVEFWVNLLTIVLLILMLFARNASVRFLNLAYIFLILTVIVTIFEISILMSVFASLVISFLGLGLLNLALFHPKKK